MRFDLLWALLSSLPFRPGAARAFDYFLYRAILSPKRETGGCRDHELALAPTSRRVVAKMVRAAERGWLKLYHASCRSVLLLCLLAEL